MRPECLGLKFKYSGIIQWFAFIVRKVGRDKPPEYIGKDSDAGRDWGQEEKGTTEDEMAGWHHQLNGPGFG